uniref:Uncharacterized protein n=1 Tax=Toxoplasma gondii COUG TaxID=1074873 RepID=A0A2G8Y831_TOXGO|nr:hypothetical protein TGCOUG_364510 [Toxoplasma gondii COUG]
MQCKAHMRFAPCFSQYTTPDDGRAARIAMAPPRERSEMRNRRERKERKERERKERERQADRLAKTERKPKESLLVWMGGEKTRRRGARQREGKQRKNERHTGEDLRRRGGTAREKNLAKEWRQRRDEARRDPTEKLQQSPKACEKRTNRVSSETPGTRGKTQKVEAKNSQRGLEKPRFANHEGRLPAEEERRFWRLRRKRETTRDSEKRAISPQQVAGVTHTGVNAEIRREDAQQKSGEEVEPWNLKTQEEKDEHDFQKRIPRK